jgi:hypothetical protein
MTRRFWSTARFLSLFSLLLRSAVRFRRPAARRRRRNLLMITEQNLYSAHRSLPVACQPVSGVRPPIWVEQRNFLGVP